MNDSPVQSSKFIHQREQDGLETQGFIFFRRYFEYARIAIDFDEWHNDKSENSS